MQIGLLQYDVAHDLNRNLNCVKSYLQKLKCDCDIVVLPELSMCGYLFESYRELLSCAETVPSGISTQTMLALSKQYSCTFIFGLAEREHEKVFNTAVIVSKGRYIGKYRKIHLSDYEKKLFARGNENLPFEVDGLKIGVQICFDLWFPEVSREQIRMGADILCVLANFGGDTTYHISKIRAIENQTPLVLCNRIGVEAIPGMDAEFLGKSTAVAASGQRIYIAPPQNEDFGLCDVDVVKIKSNVICSDFDSEIAFHYQTPAKREKAAPNTAPRIERGRSL